MEDGVQSLHDLRLGDPIKFGSGDGVVYGRVDGFAGDAYCGTHPQVVLRTPGGTKIRLGIAWVRRITTDEDLASLAHFDRLAAEQVERTPEVAGGEGAPGTGGAT